MQNEYAKIYTKKEIENNTKMLLCYMARLAERLKKGETPMLWAGDVIKYCANLQTYYSRADDLDIWEELDFGEIYKNALEQAKQELEND